MVALRRPPCLPPLDAPRATCSGRASLHSPAYKAVARQAGLRVQRFQAPWAWERRCSPCFAARTRSCGRLASWTTRGGRHRHRVLVRTGQDGRGLSRSKGAAGGALSRRGGGLSNNGLVQTAPALASVGIIARHNGVVVVSAPSCRTGRVYGCTTQALALFLAALAILLLSFLPNGIAGMNVSAVAACALALSRCGGTS